MIEASWCGLRAVGEGDVRDAVERVVRVGRHLALGVGLGEQIARRVVGIGGRAGVGRDVAREIPQAVHGVGGGEVPRIGDPGELVRVAPHAASQDHQDPRALPVGRGRHQAHLARAQEHHRRVGPCGQRVQGRDESVRAALRRSLPREGRVK